MLAAAAAAPADAPGEGGGALQRVHPLLCKLRSTGRTASQARCCVTALRSIAAVRELPGVGNTQADLLSKQLRHHLHRVRANASPPDPGESVSPVPDSSSGDDASARSSPARAAAAAWGPSTRSAQLEGWVKGKLVGRGSSGHVFEAISGAGCGKVFAVKELPLPAASSPRQAELLSREVEMLRALSHPNIVGYYGVESSPAGFCIFMEYMPGGSVGSLARRSGGLDFRVVRSFSLQILKGLNYLHSLSPPVVHRDLKGDNILHDANGTVKLADFGTACRAAALLQQPQSGLQGTAPFLAPEVIETWGRGAYAASADMWSFGCVALEMVTGEYPWHWGRSEPMTPMQALYRIAHDAEGPPLPAGLPAQLADFIGACLRRDPAARPTAKLLHSHPFIVQPVAVERGAAASLRVLRSAASGSTEVTADSHRDLVTLSTESGTRGAESGSRGAGTGGPAPAQSAEPPPAAALTPRDPPSPPGWSVPVAPRRSRFAGRAARAAREERQLGRGSSALPRLD